jgi:hypothetical protein
MISGVFMLTTPLSPKASLGFPVFASSEYNLPSLEPKTTWGGVRASPGQYSTPRRCRGAGGELEGPDLFSSGGIDGNDAGIRRGHIHSSIDDEGRIFARSEARPAAPATSRGAFRRVTRGGAGATTVRRGITTAAGWRGEAGRLHMIDPRDLEPLDIRRRDFRQR